MKHLGEQDSIRDVAAEFSEVIKAVENQGVLTVVGSGINA